MKTIQKNKLTPSKEQQKQVSSIRQELIVFAETIGKETGIQNKPVSTDEFNLYIGKKVENTLQTTIHKNHEFYTPVAGMVLVNEIRKEGAENTRKLQAELSDAILEKNQVEAKRKPLFPDTWLLFIRRCIYVALAILGSIEGIYVFKAFRSKGMDMLTSISTGIGMAIGVSIGTHYLARWCKNALTKPRRFIRLLIALGIPCIVFLSIARIRVTGVSIDNQYNNLLPGSKPSTMNANASDLFIISYCFYLVAFFLSYIFAKTKEETEREKEFNKLTAESDRLQAKANDVQDQISIIEDTTREKSKEALENLEKAIATEREIESIAPEVLQHFIEKNIRHRTDGIPAFYNHLPKMQFQKFFDNINHKNNSNEK